MVEEDEKMLKSSLECHYILNENKFKPFVCLSCVHVALRAQQWPPASREGSNWAPEVGAGK